MPTFALCSRNQIRKREVLVRGDPQHEIRCKGIAGQNGCHFSPSREVEMVELTAAHSTIIIVSLAAINFQHAIPRPVRL